MINIYIYIHIFIYLKCYKIAEDVLKSKIQNCKTFITNYTKEKNEAIYKLTQMKNVTQYN